MHWKLWRSVQARLSSPCKELHATVTTLLPIPGLAQVPPRDMAAISIGPKRAGTLSSSEDFVPNFLLDKCHLYTVLNLFACRLFLFPMYSSWKAIK